MDPLLAVIVAMAVVLFAVAVYMEWLGLLSVLTFRSGLRHVGCGHLKLTPANDREMCWHCRHQQLEHMLHVPHQGIGGSTAVGDQPGQSGRVG